LRRDLGIPGHSEAEFVGSGGTGSVFRATDTGLNRQVAIKIVRLAEDPNQRDMFDRERKTMAAISAHPGIAPVYSTGLTINGDPYITMPFYSKGSLGARLTRGPFPWPEAVSMIAKVTVAVSWAHRHKIIHRDLKPDNIMIDDQGDPVVVDFGIAKLLEPGPGHKSQIYLTPAFAPPEALRGGIPDERFDVYSIASTLHAMISGQAPFDSTTDPITLWQQKEIGPADLGDLAPAALKQCILKGMAPDREDRHENAEVFSAALAAASIDSSTMLAESNPPQFPDPTDLAGNSNPPTFPTPSHEPLHRPIPSSPTPQPPPPSSSPADPSVAGLPSAHPTPGQPPVPFPPQPSPSSPSQPSNPPLTHHKPPQQAGSPLAPQPAAPSYTAGPPSAPAAQPPNWPQSAASGFSQVPHDPGIATPLVPGKQSKPNKKGKTIALVAAIAAALALAGGGLAAAIQLQSTTKTTTGPRTAEPNGLLSSNPGSDPDLDSDETPSTFTGLEPWTQEGDLALTELKPGHCLGELGLGTFDLVAVTPCDQPHFAEIIGILEHSAAGQDFPGQEELANEAIPLCDELFTRYVGTQVWQTELEYSFLSPTFDEWQGGSYSNACFAVRYDGGEIRGRLKNGADDPDVSLNVGDLAPLWYLDQDECFTATNFADGIFAWGVSQAIFVANCETETYGYFVGVVTLEGDLDAQHLPDSLTAMTEDLCQSSFSDTYSFMSIDSFAWTVIPDEIEWADGYRLGLCTIITDYS